MEDGRDPPDADRGSDPIPPAPVSQRPARSVLALRSSLPPSQRLTQVIARVRNPLWSMAGLVVVIYGLKEAQAVLVPVVGAALLAIIVSPSVVWLEARRVPKAAAVVAVVMAIVLALFGMGALVLGTLAGFRESSRGYGILLTDTVHNTTVWLDKRGFPADIDSMLRSIEPGAAAEKAATVLMDSLGSVVSALSNIFFLVITMILILMEGNTVPAKLRALSSEPEADISYFRQIARRVQSYLAIKTVLSIGTGILVGLWAAILKVDFAMLWGLLAFLLNYIPNIGSVLAAVPAMLLALLQHGWGTSLGLGAGYVLVNMVVGNVIEPMWLGRQMGLSTTVVFISLAVWYEIWGPIGMLLSVPLTMVLKIMLEHSRDYAFVAALLDTGETDDATDPPAVVPPVEEPIE